jgi:hypothetical protein
MNMSFKTALSSALGLPTLAQGLAGFNKLQLAITKLTKLHVGGPEKWA